MLNPIKVHSVNITKNYMEEHNGASSFKHVEIFQINEQGTITLLYDITAFIGKNPELQYVVDLYYGVNRKKITTMCQIVLMNKFINTLKDFFNHGRVMVGDHKWQHVEGAYEGRLYFREVKKLLHREHDALMFRDHLSLALRRCNPKFISTREVCRNYTIERWGTRKCKYTYLTFDQNVKDWIYDISGAITGPHPRVFADERM